MADKKIASTATTKAAAPVAKTEVKPAAAKAEPVKTEAAPAAVKAEPVKAETKTEPAKTTTAKKAPAKKTTAKKTTAKKTTTKKTTVKKTAETKTAATRIPTAVKNAGVYVQFDNKENELESLKTRIVEKWCADEGQKASAIKEMNIYIKPEDNAAYYVINGQGSSIEL